MNHHSELAHLTINGQNTYYQQLFPYLYVGNTPKVTQEDITNAFFVLPQGVQSESLFFKLANQKKAQQRLAMQNLAVNFINSDSFIRNYFQLDEHFLALFNVPFNQLLNKRDIQSFIEKAFGSLNNFNKFINLPETLTQLTNVWLSIITLLIELDYEHVWLEQLLMLVKKLNIITLSFPYLSTEHEIPQILMSSWHNANFLLPLEIFPLPKQNKEKPNAQISNAHQKNTVSTAITEYQHARAYALGTLHLVKYKLIGYTLGELKKVKTVLKGETRQQTHRQIDKSHTQLTKNVNNNQIKDQLEHNIDKDLNSQIQQTLADRRVTSTNDYTTNYQPTEPKSATTGNWTVDDSPAGGSEENKTQFIKDVLAETKDRIISEINQARQQKVEHENEHSSINTLTNNSDRNTNGFYYWLNKVYRVNASDSQKRLLIEVNFSLEDGELHQILAEQNRLTLKPPETLAQYGITHYTDILPERAKLTPTSAKETQAGVTTSLESSTANSKSAFYLDLCQQFNTPEVTPPPLEQCVIAKTIKSEQNTCNTSIPLPEGYFITSGNITVSVDANIDNITIIIAGTPVPVNKTNVPTSTNISTFEAAINQELLNTSIQGDLPIAVLTNVNSVAPATQDQTENTNDTPLSFIQISQSISIQLQLVRSEQCLNQWQFAVFSQLQAGYQQQFERYTEQLAELKQWLKTHSTPKTQSLINNYLIKKCMHRLYLNAMLHIGIDASTPQDELPYNQYFNNALDWPNLYCKLSESPSSNTTTTSLNTISTQAALSQLDDELYLKRFLTATKAKVLLPINRDQVLSFIYFLDSGQIWHGKEELTPINHQALPIINDFKKISISPNEKDTNKGSWKVTLPTTMTILSNDDDINHIGSHLDDE